ncbi:hypothetical protein [Acinetobacter nosocomialis]|uniref:hypothetical protein n=1 Tax=Acinetobacter nosocomialis TaxID=106654 RepID=UPI001D18AAC2|nr:hypothetical protein [Acinetobacter nosocomialis]
MSESKLSHRQLVLIRRAAEDAIHACNRHYGPFVDVVAHPLNIIALVDMAKESICQQAKLSEKDSVISFANRMTNLDQLKNDQLQERIDTALALLDTTSISEINRRTLGFIDQIKQVLKGEESK